MREGVACAWAVSVWRTHGGRVRCRACGATNDEPGGAARRPSAEMGADAPAGGARAPRRGEAVRTARRALPISLAIRPGERGRGRRPERRREVHPPPATSTPRSRRPPARWGARPRGRYALAARAAARSRARIGTVHQQLHLVPQASVMQNVVAGRLGRVSLLRALARSSRARGRAGAAVLAEVGSPERLHERVDRLSGGEQQRVAVARALYQDPEIVIADEPVASVDPTRALEIAALLGAPSRADARRDHPPARAAPAGRHAGDRAARRRARVRRAVRGAHARPPLAPLRVAQRGGRGPPRLRRHAPCRIPRRAPPASSRSAPRTRRASSCCPPPCALRPGHPGVRVTSR